MVDKFKRKSKEPKSNKGYPNEKIQLSPDPNTNELISRILDRDSEGLDKFKITMRAVMLKNPRDTLHWLYNALEESIDFSRYIIEAIKFYQILNEENKKLIQENLKLKNKLKKEKEYSKLLNEHP